MRSSREVNTHVGMNNQNARLNVLNWKSPRKEERKFAWFSLELKSFCCLYDVVSQHVVLLLMGGGKSLR